MAGWDVQVWETARWAVQIHGIAPLLDRAAAAWPDADALHPHLRDYLATQRQRSAARVTLLMQDLEDVLAALAAAGIQALPLKGSLLSTQYYPEAGLRPMNDLDLLVRRDAVEVEMDGGVIDRAELNDLGHGSCHQRLS